MSSAAWDRPSPATLDVGAVTWGNGLVGLTGAVTSGNSLVGSSASDWVGLDGVTALSNGNYVVVSSDWRNGSNANAGAVTRGNGTGGTVGAVTVANSLVGTTPNDFVGTVASGSGVKPLSNGGYVVVSDLVGQQRRRRRNLRSARWHHRPRERVEQRTRHASGRPRVGQRFAHRP